MRLYSVWLLEEVKHPSLQLEILILCHPVLSFCSWRDRELYGTMFHDFHTHMNFEQRLQINHILCVAVKWIYNNFLHYFHPIKKFYDVFKYKCTNVGFGNFHYPLFCFIFNYTCLGMVKFSRKISWTYCQKIDAPHPPWWT